MIKLVLQSFSFKNPTLNFSIQLETEILFCSTLIDALEADESLNVW